MTLIRFPSATAQEGSSQNTSKQFGKAEAVLGDVESPGGLSLQEGAISPRRHVRSDNVLENAAGGLERHLGVFSCTLLIVGRIIGTGIFSTPSSILLSVGSVGASLVLWVLGFVLPFCGLFIWLEFGIMIPRSGGEKVYLEAAYTKPKYLVTVIFATNAILLGFSASNCLVSLNAICLVRVDHDRYLPASKLYPCLICHILIVP